MICHVAGYLCCPRLRQEDIPLEPKVYSTGASRIGSNTYEFAPSHPQPARPAEGSHQFFDAIVVMETVEEVRALMLVRAACSDLSMAVFE